MPADSEPDLLARIELSPRGSAPADALETLDLIGQRRTDRRRFTSWPIPGRTARAAGACRPGRRTGAPTRSPVADVATRRRTELLVERRRANVSRSGSRGLTRARTSTRSRSPDGLLFLCTAEDDQRAWLQAGQALSALWLRATRDGLSIVPLSQVIDVDETRDALAHDVFGGLAHPQILVRVGWQEISRHRPPAHHATAAGRRARALIGTFGHFSGASARTGPRRTPVR